MTHLLNLFKDLRTLKTTMTATISLSTLSKMAQQQEVRQKNSNKKVKERKVPQRGLGVAQLERIRLESQKKTTPTPTPPPPHSHSSCSAIQCHPSSIFRHNSLPSPTAISFPHLPPPPPPPPTPPPTAADLAPRNAILRKVSSTPVHFRTDGGGVDSGWPVISNLKQQGQPNHHHLLVTYLPNMNLAYETGPVHPPQNVIIQRAQQIQEQPSPSPMVNVTPPTSSTPSVITYHQVELPSNQSISDKNYAVVWSEGKIVGMKRPYPFSLDPPNPSFPSKFPQLVAPSIKTPDESGNLVFREGSSRTNPKSVPNPKIIGGVNRDFLTLAPPRTASPTLDNREIVDLESSSFQLSVGHPDHPPGSSESAHQQPLYSFFPPTNAQTREVTTRSSGSSKEAGEKLDLSLKL